MIDLLKNWIRNVITIVIFANIIELLLPNSSMRKYVKVVMGFFILLTILNPLFKLLNVDLSTFSVFNNSDSQAKYRSSYVEGNALQKKNQQLVVATFEKHFAEQIKALVLTQADVSDATVEVSADTQGKIEHVLIHLTLRKQGKNSATKTSIAPIKEIKIGVDTKASPKKQEARVVASKRVEEIQKQITQLVMSFYNLKTEEISFQ